jgi:Ca2+-binding EF-hand superfamily protein
MKYNRSGFIKKDELHRYLKQLNVPFLVKRGEIYRMSNTNEQPKRNPLTY